MDFGDGRLRGLGGAPRRRPPAPGIAAWRRRMRGWPGQVRAEPWRCATGGGRAREAGGHAAGARGGPRRTRGPLLRCHGGRRRRGRVGRNAAPEGRHLAGILPTRWRLWQPSSGGTVGAAAPAPAASYGAGGPHCSAAGIGPRHCVGCSGTPRSGTPWPHCRSPATTSGGARR